jgi:hypothetical protein
MARHLGCHYQLCETAPKAETPEIGQLRAEDMRALPEQLRQGLREAIVTLNPKRISAAIDHISERDTELGLILRRYAESSAYSQIFNAIDTEVHDNGAL